ncbi:arylsulfotransferase family protein [Actinacidiphila paucisporea]|uniref:Arylsulfotransferase (ASST) n=1 Tax=Actinacidiphila paucisporea TaxID=310782 RepID=A0A1M7I170_9ACTN|nr:arylsulfotransferase family protein [Actinacidiphila paucisporea]SHM34408.1 Arylsulfotransferase (ASST) [Actinacidiphila paucisporea]
MRKKSLTRYALAAAAAAVVPATVAAAAPAPADSLPLAPVTVLTDKPGTAHGDLFVSPNAVAGKYAGGVEILSQDGRETVWSHALPAGQSAADFRKQTYHGKPVLTWWEGTGLGGAAQGVDVVYNDHYQKIAEVRAGNGYSADGHEFLITPRNTALILAYTVKTADLRSIGGAADQKVIDGVVQEVDIRTGKVLFEWNSADHVPYAQSEQPLPASADTPWDWFHVNAVKLDTGGNLLVDARNTWTAYEVSHRTGSILWQVGGKAGSFALKAAPGQVLNSKDTIFAWQHDPEPLGGGLYSFFDNESAGIANTGSGAVSELPYSRVATVRINPRTRTATLVASEAQPSTLVASSQGNAQPLGDGHTVVGWGSLPYVSEFGRRGELLFNAQFPAGVNSYRAYRFDWR